MTGTRIRACRLAVVLAIGATALVAGGCGGSSKTTTRSVAAKSTTSATAPATTTSSGGSTAAPADAVAVAAGRPITHAAFEHWLTVAAKASATAKTPAIVPSDPPDFSNCIAQARHKLPSLAHTSQKQLKADCAQLFTSLSDQVMDFLITSDWYQAYAARLNLTPSTRDVSKAFKAEKAQAFPTESKFQAFLKQEGETMSDVQSRVLVGLIAQRLAAREKGSQQARQTAVQSKLKRAYLASTVCTPLVAMADCSNFHASTP